MSAAKRKAELKDIEMAEIDILCDEIIDILELASETGAPASASGSPGCRPVPGSGIFP